MKKPIISVVPGTHEAVIGVFVWQGKLIPVVDATKIYSAQYDETAEYVLILDGRQPYALLVDEINDLVRDNIPADVSFISAQDFETVVLNDSHDHQVSKIELF